MKLRSSVLLLALSAVSSSGVANGYSHDEHESVSADSEHRILPQGKFASGIKKVFGTTIKGREGTKSEGTRGKGGAKSKGSTPSGNAKSKGSTPSGNRSKNLGNGPFNTCCDEPDLPLDLIEEREAIANGLPSKYGNRGTYSSLKPQKNDIIASGVGGGSGRFNGKKGSNFTSGVVMGGGFDGGKLADSKFETVATYDNAPSEYDGMTSVEVDAQGNVMYDTTTSEGGFNPQESTEPDGTSVGGLEGEVEDEYGNLEYGTMEEFEGMGEVDDGIRDTNSWQEEEYDLTTMLEDGIMDTSMGGDDGSPLEVVDFIPTMKGDYREPSMMEESASRRRLRGSTTNDKALEEQEHRNLGKWTGTEIDTFPIGLFHPLDCNYNNSTNVDTVSCSKTFSELVGVTEVVEGPIEGPITIPCGECITYDLAGEVTIEGLDIQGKLVVPSDHSATLRSPYVFVQGVLAMSSTTQISPSNKGMTIVLTGDQAEDAPEVTFTPVDSNANAGSFNVGYKPFLVAGGRLDIHGWDEGESGSVAWTPLLSSAEAPMPTIIHNSTAGWEQLPLPPPEKKVPVVGEVEQCPRQLVSHDFNTRNESIYEVWSGGDGKIVHHHDEGFIQLTHLDLDWQGFRLDITEITQECPIIEDATYLVTMRIKIDLEDAEAGSMTECEESATNCPRLTRKILRNTGMGDKYHYQYLQRGSIGRYGEWFWFSSTWKWSGPEQLGDDIVGQIFYLDKFPHGSVVSMDDFILELPSEKSFAPAIDSCSELAINGDAEDTDGKGHAYYPFVSTDSSDQRGYVPLILNETLEDGNINKFYRNKSRRWYSHAQRFKPNTNCFVKGYIYTVSMKTRIHEYGYDNPISYHVYLTGKKPDGNGYHFYPLICRDQKNMARKGEWVECSAPLLIDDIIASLTDVQWTFQTDYHSNYPYREIRDEWAVFDFDDISIAFESGPDEGLTVSGPASDRWGLNSEVHISSTTMDWKDSQVRNIETVTRNDDGSTTLSFDSPIDAVLSEMETPGMGAEIALLTRNIKIEGSCDVANCHGGYLQVLHTPNVSQTIEGVEFSNMGQKGARNRFPIQFLYTRDVEGTSISRNAVRNSNHRCISMDGVTNATISGNVAHDTAGHCFYMGHEAMDNVLVGNLASKTNNLITRAEQMAGSSDSQPCTFFIRNNQNNFTGNVAAGSSGHGWYFPIDYRWYGEDDKRGSNNIGPTDSPRRRPMGIFKGNKAHSNILEGISMHNFEQFFTFRDEVNVPLFEDTSAYRNRQRGVYLRNVQSAIWRGGSFSDNQWGLELVESDRQLLENIDIVGSSKIFKDHTAFRALKLCQIYSWTHTGIRMMSTVWRTGHLDMNLGLRMRNVTISGFDKEKSWYPLCKSTEPISFLGYLHNNGRHYHMRDAFDYVSSTKNVTIEDSRRHSFAGCPMSDLGIKDVVITDLDGSLDPAKPTNTNGGVLVSDEPHMTEIIGNGTCKSAGDCMSYCPGVCLRTFFYKVEQFGTENWKLKISNNDTQDETLVPGTMRSWSDSHFSHAYSSRRFSASLPVGNYTAQFIDDEGNTAWPKYAEEIWLKEPDCSGFVSMNSVTLAKPPLELGECDELVHNGGEGDQNGTLATTEPWLHTMYEPGDVDIMAQGSEESDAICATQRQHHWTGPGQNVDSRCLEQEKGQFYEFSAWMKVTEKGDPDTIIQTIDTNQRWYRNKSPLMTFQGRKYRDDAKKEHIYSWEDYEEAVLARPYNTSGWNLLHGIGRLVDTPRGFWEIERAPDNMDFIVDSAKFTKMRCNPEELLLNGNLEEGNSKYWDTWGETVALDLVPGYGGSGSALKASSRGHMSYGPAQIINTDCASESGTDGARLAFSGRIKYEDAGQTTTCTPLNYNHNQCPHLTLYTKKNRENYDNRHWDRVARIVTDESESNDGWYNIHGLHTLRPNQVQADFTKIYFEGIDKKYDMIVDDVQIKYLPHQCEALVENPSFDSGSAFWGTTDMNYSWESTVRMKMDLVPGASGSADDFAMRIFARNHNYRGITQKLDARCFVSGNKYSISAKFRMLKGGEGVDCTTNDKETTSNNCPSIVLYGLTGCNTPNGRVYSRYWNSDSSESSWDPNAFNDFRTSLTVTEELASCDEVWVYVHEVNKDFDLVVDDLQISSASESEMPTLSPTVSATAPLTDGDTSTPTTSPTTRPTVSTMTICPIDQSIPTKISSGPVMLARSSSLCILTKAIDIDGTLSSIAQLALSYDGGDWEIASGKFAMSLFSGHDFGDYTDGSHITLPNLDGNADYYLTSYSHTLTNADDTVARLLESATFGTTTKDLSLWNEPLTTDSAKEWIKNQMSINMTSHREFFRHRTNPRLNHPVGIARSNHPCDALSRWRKFAFTRKDGAQLGLQQFEAVFNPDTDDYITIKLNGHARTVVKSLSFPHDSKYALEFNREYSMCSLPTEYVDGVFKLEVNEDTNECEDLPNPLVNFYPNSVQPPNVLRLSAVSVGILGHIDEVQSHGGEYIHVNGLEDDMCGQLNDVAEETDAPVFGQLPDGSWLIFDARMKLEENTLVSHIPDGGGLVRSISADATRCANVPRTFLNEEQCSLSDSAMACGSAGTPNLLIELNSDNIIEMHTLTGQYVYAVDGLPLRDIDNFTQPSPCVPELRSRWEILPADSCTETPMGELTNATLFELLRKKGGVDENPDLRDITFPMRGSSCTDGDNLVEVEILVGTQCFRRVHPDHLSVYDMTYWADEFTHPGNMIASMNLHPNPIKKWIDIDDDVILVYPAFRGPDAFDTLAAHPINRWVTHSHKFSYLGRFGDAVKFVDLPNEIRLDEVALQFGADTDIAGGNILVCGSPQEAANDPSLGQVFEVTTGRDTEWNLWRQREHTWMQVGLTAPDQLRQRVAWALSQLLVIARGAIEVQGSHSEVFLTYYDIFTRNAFGNYRDVLREISYSPLMAENLSYLGSKSAAYIWETQDKISFADENFAREIMQLFSTGLVKLNLDGTTVLDDDGKPVLAYTNDEIMSFARVWTGFDYQQGRGNVEETSRSGNRHDPMKIQAAWRDKFPKTDMTGGYIGDGYPLCVDLPDKMFLRKGATYHLLGASYTPGLMEDHSSFATDPSLKKFELNSTSSLSRALACGGVADGTNCRWENTVTLMETYNCTMNECDADTLRVVQVRQGLHYEYIRPPCVEQVFYANAKKIIYKERQADSSCANPLLPYASEACCEGTHDQVAERSPDYLYDQERVVYSTADSRCKAMGMEQCDFNSIDGIDTHKKGYHWTPDSCIIQVKVNSIGQVALVYEPESYAFLHPHVKLDNRNFFKVYWDGDFPKNSEDVSYGNDCGNGSCDALDTGGCLCDTSITKSRVFWEMPSSAAEVLSKLTIGAYDHAAYDAGTYEAPTTVNDVTVYLASASGVFDTKTVFEVTDEHGRLQRFRNVKERVHIKNAEYAFRNAPSFMSVLNTEADERDAHFETEAALDEYFYHDNTAPFIAFRLIQRFTTSNPKPRYVKAVATAFRNGIYDGIGEGNYGDLAATIAAVLLDPEARSVNLDADPFKGNLREPLLRMMALMRGLELHQAASSPVVQMFDLDEKIGQMAHSFPTVFSFMLPEYSPGGRPGDATLVGPETMIMDMPKVLALLNGMFSMVKYGLSRCHGGFGGKWTGCNEGDFRSATAHLSFSRPYDGITGLEEHADNVVSELSTLLTSGRLSGDNKRLIMDAYISKLNNTEATDPSGSALRLAEQLVLTTPEFHTTNTVAMTGELRDNPGPPVPFGTSYKAIVYVMFGGGCDSFNMLVPHACSVGNEEPTLYDEYKGIRQDIALDYDSMKVLDGNMMPNQACETFAVHPQLEYVQKMFNDGDLLFFANTGVLTKEVNKENYWKETETRLFAHNFMQQAAQRVDPLKKEDATGILGRMRDALTRKGLSVGAFSINARSISLIGEPGLTASPMILTGNGITTFNEAPSSENMDATIALLNGKTNATSTGVFGDWYSDTLVKSLSHNQLLYDTLTGKETEHSFPNSHLGRQLEMAAKMISSREERGTDADMFFLSTGGWDTHSNVLMNQVRLFGGVDEAFKSFALEMKSNEIWDHVTLIQTSDFARTLTQNGNLGSDHAWGGNYIMMGGGIKGGQIVGTYPSIKEGAPLNIGRGRIIPTTSWEAVFLPLAEWAGVGSAEFDYICPNRDNFPETHFFPAADLFEL